MNISWCYGAKNNNRKTKNLLAYWEGKYGKMYSEIIRQSAGNSKLLLIS